jgi:phosphomannomutase
MQDFINFCLDYMSKLRLPFKRYGLRVMQSLFLVFPGQTYNSCIFSGTFIETRSGLINIAPCGRNSSNTERDEFEKYDKVS